MRPAKYHKGMSGVSVLTVIVIAAVFAAVAFVIVPPIFDNWTLQSICEKLDGKRDVISQGPKKIRSYIQAELQRNGIRDFDPSVIQIISDGNSAVIDIKYEVRKELSLSKRIDVVVKFNEKFKVSY